MKKLAILALHLGFGGVESAVTSLCNMLCDSYDITVYVTYRLSDTPAFPMDSRVKICYLTGLKPNKDEFKSALKKGALLRAAREGFKSVRVLRLRKSTMIAAIKASDSDIIISTRILFNELLGRYAKPGTLKIAQEHRHHRDDEAYIKRLKASLKNIDIFMPVSAYLTEFYAKRFPNKCVYIPHTLGELPENISPLDGRGIITVGRLECEKGYSDLLEVFALVHKREPDIKLHITGDGSQRDMLEEKAARLEINGSVTFHGSQKKEYIAKLNDSCFCYVMTSLEESFGLVLIEAMSHGLPCVTFDSAMGAREIIEHEKTGFLVENRSFEDMAEKILLLYRDENFRKSMGRHARQAADFYSNENIREMWNELPRDAARKNDRS